MDLSELKPDVAKAAPGPAAARETAEERGLRELLGQVGSEVVIPMASALERINAFAATGRIDRSGLRALRDEVEQARRVGLAAQQICRFASGRVRQRPERRNLAQALSDALAQRNRETAARGLELRQDLQTAEVLIDASMLSALLQALLDWAFEHARSHLDFAVDLRSWPTHARLQCRFAQVPADEQPPEATELSRRLETTAWQLLSRLAQVLGLLLQRQDEGSHVQLSIEFPRTVSDAVLNLTPVEAEAPALPWPNSQPMVGRHVLVIAARRETRNSVRVALRALGLMVDFVASVDEAREFCAHGLPHAVVYEAALAGDHFQRLRAQWAAEAPALAFLEIEEGGRALEVADHGSGRTSRIGRDVLSAALPHALMLELARGA